MLLATFLLIGNAAAQTNSDTTLAAALAFFQQANASLLGSEQLSLKYEYASFHEASTQPEEVLQGFLVRDKERYWQEDLNRVVLLDKRYELYVDHAQQRMRLSPRKQKKLPLLTMSAEDLEAQVQSATPLANGALTGYRYFFATGQVRTLELWCDANGQLHHSRLHYHTTDAFGNAQKTVLEVRYLEVAQKVTQPIQLETFLSVSRKAAQLAPQYAHYQLENLL